VLIILFDFSVYNVNMDFFWTRMLENEMLYDARTVEEEVEVVLVNNLNVAIIWCYSDFLI